MKTILALCLVLPLGAAADEISDREQRNAERRAAEIRQNSANYRAQGNAEKLGAFFAWAQNHGGLRSGTCTVSAEDCFERGRYDAYCPLRNSGDHDIRGLGASGEYIVRSCRVVTGDGSACVLDADWDRSQNKKTVYKATCTPEGGDRYELSFRGDGRDFRAPPLKPQKEEYDYSRPSYRSLYYGYGYGLYGNARVYNCYGEQCNYYVGGKLRKKKGH